jgi:hypothetical protein
MENKAIATIPFQGFYDSLYSHAIDSEMENSIDYYYKEYELT